MAPPRGVIRTSPSGYAAPAARFRLSSVRAQPLRDVGPASPRRSILKDNKGRTRAVAWTTGKEDWIDVAGTARFRFVRASREVTAFVAPGCDRRSVVDTYFGTVLPLLLQLAVDLEALHGSGVALRDTRVAAFCAESETGKTTLAYALSRRGYELWADDAVVFDTAQLPIVASIRLPFRIQLRADAAEHFRTDDELLHDGIPEEAVWDLDIAPRSPLAAVFICQRASSDPTVETLASGEALTLAMAHAYRYRPLTAERNRRMFESYLDLVANIPIFRASFRPGLGDLDPLLDEIEGALRGVSPPA